MIRFVLFCFAHAFHQIATALSHIPVCVSFRLHHIGLRSFVLQFLIDKFVFSLNAGFFFCQRQFLFLNL